MKKSLTNSPVVGVVLSFLACIIAFNVFIKNKTPLDTENDWKYYASLTGFIIFACMFLLSVAALFLRKRKQTKE